MGAGQCAGVRARAASHLQLRALVLVLSAFALQSLARVHKLAKHRAQPLSRPTGWISIKPHELLEVEGHAAMCLYPRLRAPFQLDIVGCWDWLHAQHVARLTGAASQAVQQSAPKISALEVCLKPRRWRERVVRQDPSPCRGAITQAELQVAVANANRFFQRQREHVRDSAVDE